jgi:hypothetical protein
MIATFLDHSTQFSAAHIAIARGTAYRICCDPAGDGERRYLGDDRTMAPYWVDAGRALVFSTMEAAMDYANARQRGEHAQYRRAATSRPGVAWRIESFDYNRGACDADVQDVPTACTALVAFARSHGHAAWPVVTAGGWRVAVQSDATYRWDDDTGVTVSHVDVVDDLASMRRLLGY